MPTQLPTQTYCLNCNYEVKTENKYCPSCGQENANKRISLRLLVQDAIATAFNLESRVLKTIPYFLFYPGRLTNEFLEGKRVRYMHPFKIYLLSSLLFFFVVIKLFTPALEDAIRKLDKASEDINEKISLADSTKNQKNTAGFDIEITQNAEEENKKKLAFLKDSIGEVLANVKKGKINEVVINVDSLENLLQDSVLLAQSSILANKEIEKKNGGLRRFIHLIQDREMTPERLLDSLNNDKSNFMSLQFAEQLLKIGRNDLAIFSANIINNIGTLMFFTLPLLAFFFMPFYLRRKKYYIDHLIFTLHLQAFTFVILTLAALFFHWDFYSISIILCVLLSIYAWLSFKKVYKQGFFKTTIKAYIISFLYLMTLVFMLSLNLIYSFFMF